MVVWELQCCDLDLFELLRAPTCVRYDVPDAAVSCLSLPTAML
jgi:hypothetical protein